jgi:hypothetical protein
MSRPKIRTKEREPHGTDPDFKACSALAAIDAMTLQNLNLRIELLTRERDAFGRGLIEKYAHADEDLHIEASGKLRRVKKP